MATDPLDYDLTDAENGDTDAMARVLQSLIPSLSRGTARERFLAVKLSNICAAYHADHSNTNKAYPNAEDNIQIVTPDLNILNGMPNLSTPDGRERVMDLVVDADIVIVDNISTLSHGGKENEAESWEPLQTWALKVRAMGKSVLFVHHANKSGGQRGTSKKEDIMDTIIRLDHPVDYDPAQGARFNVTYDKCRNISGTDTEGFEAHLTAQGWTFKGITDVRLQQVHELKALDPSLSVRDIADALGIPSSTVQRLLKKTPPP